MSLLSQPLIGFTDGIFDGCHQGHHTLWETCRMHCDILVVGVYSDAYTRFCKGEQRPHQPYDVRMNAVRSNEWVDRVLLLEDVAALDSLLQSGMIDLWFHGERQTNRLKNAYPGVLNRWVKRTEGISSTILFEGTPGPDDH